MKFGVFDHFDDNGLSRADQFAMRLEFAAAIERAGFYAYHQAEHHATRLSAAPSPNVFLATLAQRTTTLKFGTLVYLLQLHHPLRLYEEICMLDQLSGGRLQVGVGRGGAVHEHARFGVAPAQGQAMYEECRDVLLRCFSEESVTHEGRFFTVKDYPVTIRPAQRPHPPLWYGSTGTDSAAWAARNRINVVTLGEDARARDIARACRASWSACGRAEADLPHVGTMRHIVVAGTDADAKRIARTAYREWRASMTFLSDRDGALFSPLLAGFYPEDWDAFEALGHGFAGTPDDVAHRIADLRDMSGINYLACHMLFGRMDLSDALRSVDLFGAEILPKFSESRA